MYKGVEKVKEKLTDRLSLTLGLFHVCNVHYQHRTEDLEKIRFRREKEKEQL